jgi:hypothetical protein
MTGDITEVKYWLDLFVKSIIGIVVGIVGLDYRSMKNSLAELEETKYNLQMQVQAVELQLKSFESSLEKIDKKLDKALDK